MVDFAFKKIYSDIRENKSVLLTAFVSALMAYMFILSNKLVSPDEIYCLFGKGSTISSGRWGLELSRLIFPDYSMPWLYGLASIVLLCTAACLTVKIFRIKSKVTAAILAAVFITLPTEAITLAYMFTAAPYALALLCAVSSVYFFTADGIRKRVCSVPLLTFGLGIYQAYIGVAAAYLLVWLFMLVLDEETDGKTVFLKGIEALVFLAVSLLLYYGINLLAQKISGQAMNYYASASLGSSSIAERLFNAYKSFFGFFYRGHYDLVRLGFPWVLHYFCLFIVGAEAVCAFFREKSKLKRLLMILIAALLPLGVNFTCLIADNLHNLMLYGFAAVYILAAVVSERMAMRIKNGGIAKKLITAGLALVVITNIFYANQLYLKMYLQYQEAKSFYTSIASGIMMTPGYDADDRIILLGNAEKCLYTVEDIDTEDVAGVREGLINIYCRSSFMAYYCGYDFPIADDAEAAEIRSSGKTDSMPVFPYNGYIQKIDDYIVVKLN